MQIDYICLPRVSLDDLAGAFQLPRSQESGLSADLNVGGEPEVRHCGGIQEARDDTLGGNPKTAIAGIFSFFTFEVKATTATQGLSVQNGTLSKAKAYGKVPGVALLNPF